MRCLKNSFATLLLAGTALLVAAAAAAQQPDAGSPHADTAKRSESNPPASADAGAADAGTDVPADAGADAGPSETTRTLTETATHVRDLIMERLALGVDPRTLFDVDIDDARAVDLEAARLERLLETLDAGAPAPRTATSTRPARPAPPSDAGLEDGGRTDAARDLNVSPEELGARLELDRARLDYYRLGKADRERLLAAHATRQASEPVSNAERQLDAAEQRARDAEDERQRALSDARRARTEALRLVAEEQARLLGIAQRQAEFDKTLLTTRTDLDAHEVAILGWHRRIREMVGSAERGASSSEQVDALYLELRKELRAARDRLADAIDGVRAESGTPTAGDDPLKDLRTLNCFILTYTRNNWSGDINHVDSLSSSRRITTSISSRPGSGNAIFLSASSGSSVIYES
jgi:hypothetical protein